MFLIEWLKAILYGIVEGMTEWLPVSSTGHLILLNEFVSFQFENPTFAAEFWEMFEVVIQLGAVMAVVILYWNRLWPFSLKHTSAERRSIWMMWTKIVVAGIPAGIIGVFGDLLLKSVTGKDLDGWLYNGITVAIALISYGIIFMFAYQLRGNRPVSIETLDELDHKTALKIGLIQLLALVPGTSRSGSTILGGMALGLSRTAAAEFSFFLAVPIMAGASFIKGFGFVKYLVTDSVSVPANAWVCLGIAFFVAFAVSMAAIRFLTEFVRKHSFFGFGVYRIALGVLVLLDALLLH